MAQEFVGLKAIAKALGITVKGLFQWRDGAGFPLTKRRGRWTVRTEEIDAWLKSRIEAQRAARGQLEMLRLRYLGRRSERR